MKHQKNIVCAVVIVLVVGLGVKCYFSNLLCHFNLKCIEQKDSWFGAKIKREIPLFTPTYAETVTEGYHAEKIEYWLDTNIANLSKRHKQIRNANREISCAVVGNGITLRDSALGNKIDEHELVIRMNNAPISGFEKDVGVKTAINLVINNPKSFIGDYGPDTMTVVWGGADAISSLSYQLFGRGRANVSERVLIASPKTAKVVVLSEQFRRYIDSNWFTPSQRFTFYDNPSTGLVAIVLSFHLCDTVSLFGFGPDGKQRLSRYFELNEMLVRHAPDFQGKFIDEITRRKIVKFYRGNLQPTDPPSKFDPFLAGFVPLLKKIQ